MERVNFIELKKIEKEVLKGICIKEININVQRIAAFDIGFFGNKVVCAAIVFEYPSLDVIEVKHNVSEELMPYSPNTVAFREGPAIIELYRELENKPDILIIDGYGVLHPNKIGVASYVGVLLNMPAIGVSKDLIYGNLEEDRILFNGEIKGYAIKTKEFARPVFVTAGHNISVEKAVEIVKATASNDFKLPIPLHLAHKETNKIKKELKEKKDGQ